MFSFHDPKFLSMSTINTKLNKRGYGLHDIDIILYVDIKITQILFTAVSKLTSNSNKASEESESI